MNYNRFITKYGIIFLVMMLLKFIIYEFINYNYYETLSLKILENISNDDLMIKRIIESKFLLERIISYIVNIVLAAFAIIDLRRLKSNFYLIPLIIVLNSIIGISLLFAYYLYFDITKRKSNAHT